LHNALAKQIIVKESEQERMALLEKNLYI